MSFQEHRRRFYKLPFSEQLHTYAEHHWQQIVRHRFTDALGDGTLHDDILARYLTQEYALTHAHIRVAANALADAPDMAQKHILAGYLAAVSGEKNAYFQRSLATLGIPEHHYRRLILPPTARILENALLDAAGAGYPYAITSLLASQWSLLAWTQRQRGKHPPRYYQHEWLTLHDNPAFAHFVDWLRAQTDKFAHLLPTVQNDLAWQFSHLCEHLHQYFDALYTASSAPTGKQPSREPPLYQGA